MRYLLLIAFAAIAGCAEERKPAPKPEASLPEIVRPQVTADDLQNLVACARRTLPTLSADEIGAVAASIKHAEADITIMRAAATPPTAEDKARAK